MFSISNEVRHFLLCIYLTVSSFCSTLLVAGCEAQSSKIAFFLPSHFCSRARSPSDWSRPLVLVDVHDERVFLCNCAFVVAVQTLAFLLPLMWVIVNPKSTEKLGSSVNIGRFFNRTTLTNLITASINLGI